MALGQCIYCSCVLYYIEMKEVKTNIRLDDRLRLRYKIAAAKKDTSMAELIRNVLERGIKEFER